MKRTHPGHDENTLAGDATEIEAGLISSSSAPSSRKASGVGSALAQHSFLIGLVLTITLARVDPWLGSDNGPLYPRITMKYGAVVAIFMVSGLSMKSEQLKGAIAKVPIHVFVQGFTLGLFPVFMKYLVVPGLLQAGVPSVIAQGFLAMSCMPPPVSTAVILTKTVGGNEAAAIFNSALGSLLGVLVTPLELILLLDPNSPGEMNPKGRALGANGAEDNGRLGLLMTVFLDLSYTVVVPLVIGQFLRPLLSDYVDAWKPKLSLFTSCTLLLVIYTTFCNTFCPPSGCESDSFVAPFIFPIGVKERTGAVEIKPVRDPLSVLSTRVMITSGVTVIIVQALLMSIIFVVTTHFAEKFRLTRADIVAVIYCSVHKSLTIGVPVLKIVFAQHPSLSLLTMPILMYHPVQIVMGGLIAPSLRSWMIKDKPGLSAVSPTAKPPLKFPTAEVI